MTKKAYKDHLREVATWQAVAKKLTGETPVHYPGGCIKCLARKHTLERNAARRALDGIRRDIGLVQGRDSTGRKIWE